jgi:cytochrome b involved in lipid metabolism
MRHIVPAAIGMALCIVGIAFVAHQFKPAASGAPVYGGNVSAVISQQKPVSRPGGTTSTTPPKPRGTTAADVAKHSNASSCWTIINGSVYDLTKWISQHPGGEGAILSLCGVDGSSAFSAQHGGNGRVLQVLSSFRIGMLAK